MMLLELLLKHNDGQLYFSSEANKEYKHWYVCYQRMNLLAYPILDKTRDSLASLLAVHIHEEQYRSLIHDSIFFESLLLDYCYKNKDIENEYLYMIIGAIMLIYN